MEDKAGFHGQWTRTGLLADREVDEARDAPRRVEFPRALLGAADALHGRAHLEEQIGAGPQTHGVRS